MFLKSVELEGYTSFDENTRVTFADGITAIFGSNSCGKHNFIRADGFNTPSLCNVMKVLNPECNFLIRTTIPRCFASRFVIEAITLELGVSDDGADAADDVIFRGTEQYAKSTCAKVTLTLEDETKIMRLLSCAGENNFFINEKTATKNEVHSLLENAGLPNGEGIVITQEFVQEFAKNNCNKKLSRAEKMIKALSSILSGDKNLPPIYFLDRVDVLFDALNCQRFIDMLHETRKKSQIIVITHNKKVIMASSQMIGVSKEESGVSKAVSLELSDGMF